MQREGLQTTPQEPCLEVRRQQGGTFKSWKKRAVQLEWTAHRSICVQEREVQCFQANKAGSLHARSAALGDAKAKNSRGAFRKRSALAAGLPLFGH